MQVIESSYGFFIGRVRDDGSCEAPMTREGARRTGCSAVFGSANYCGSSPNVRTYTTAKAAREKLRRLLEGDE